MFTFRPYNIAHSLIYLDNMPIKNQPSYTYLGLQLDHKLTWREHIQENKIKCFKSLYILKALSPTQWGGDPITLVMLHKSFIRSKMDYGAVLYGSAAKSSLMH